MEITDQHRQLADHLIPVVRKYLGPQPWRTIYFALALNCNVAVVEALSFTDLRYMDINLEYLQYGVKFDLRFACHQCLEPYDDVRRIDVEIPTCRLKHCNFYFHSQCKLCCGNCGTCDVRHKLKFLHDLWVCSDCFTNWVWADWVRTGKDEELGRIAWRLYEINNPQ